MRDLPGTIASLSERLSKLTADEVTATKHAADPITIGKRPWSREDAPAVLTGQLDAMPRNVRDTTRVPQLGIASLQDSSGLHVTQVIPGSSAAIAGVEPGDQLISVGGFNAEDPNWTESFRSRYARQPEGSALPVVVRRKGGDQTLTAHLHFVLRVESRLVEDGRASARARRIREGILRGATGP